MIEAELICDSISEAGDRLTTMQLRYPRFIHAEFMTHRVFSRNASSSRAVPTKKLLEEVKSNALRAAPIFWGKNQPGMQAVEELTGDNLTEVKWGWEEAARYAAGCAMFLERQGAHKQIVNRILEPFTHINVVVTATDWDNFFGLRIHKDAQPEMQALARAMWDAMEDNLEPRRMAPGINWHLPYFDPEDWDHLMQAHKSLDDIDRYMTAPGEIPGSGSYAKDLAIKVSVARCARVSYTSFETGKRSTIEEDLKLYDRLLSAQPFHASPAEHQATPDQLVWSHSRNANIWKNKKLHGNFHGWCQFRKTLVGEDAAPLQGFNTANPKGSYDANADLHRQAGRSS